MSGERPATIRLASAAEGAAVAALRRAERGVADDPGFESRFEEWFAAEGSRRLTWVAELDRSLVGCVSLFEYRRMPVPGSANRAWGYLSNMFVLEPFRYSGIGTMLRDAALATADERGYVRVVLAPSIRSIPFYQRAGFVDAGEGAGTDRLMVRRGRTRS
jgi:GNAT superfamily N-acetyltransferase